MTRIVLATNNQGKVKEMEKLLEGLGVEILTLQDFPGLPEVVEDGETFRENAAKKAKTIAMSTNYIAVADDSGLEVDYLNGAPGVHSARFAGEEKNDRKNNQKLLELLNGVPDVKRSARFRCVIAIATPVGEVFYSEGICEGRIGHEEKGDMGFGYDPLFYVPEFEKTFAELDLETKNQISHRGKALKEAKKILENLLDIP